MNTDDNESVRRFLNGDRTAFYEIVEKYKKKVYFIALDVTGDHHEAEDISQEVFIKMFRFIHKFRMDSKLSSWIYQITINTSIDAIRKNRKKNVLMENAQMESLPSDPAVPGASPESQAALDMLHQRIRTALPKLSKKEHSVFVMRYFNDFKSVEIAEILNISVNTIKTLLLRGKKKLRKELANYHWDSNPEVSYE